MPAVTITGENDYARSAELRRRLEEFKRDEDELNIERLDGEDAEFVRISEALTSLPFLANKKMVVFSSPGKSKEFAEAAETLLGNLPESTELVLYEPKFDKRSGLYKLLKKQTDFKDFPALDSPRLGKWIVDEAKRHNATISTGTARYLIERVGANQQLLASEIEKLSLPGGTIDQNRIDAMTDATPQSTIFQLLDAAMGGKTARAIELYDEQRRMKVEPQQILSMFAWQLHIAALVKTAGERGSDQVAREARISPYVAGKTQNLVRGMTLGRLVQLLEELVRIDARSKREALDVDDALRLFIISLGA